MLVRFLGFSIETPESIGLSSIMDALARQQVSAQEANGQGRFLFVDTASDSEYYLGLIVTVKNQRTFCELKETANSFKVQVNRLGRGSNIMEFNFFVVNKTSGIGLYQHYHQSCSIGQGMNLVKKCFYEVKQQKREEKKNEFIAKGDSLSKAENKAKKQIKGFFKWHVLVRKDKLSIVLSELKKIKALEVDIAYLEPEEKDFGMLSGFVKKQRRKISFVDKVLPELLIDPIVSAIENLKAESGRVFGIDEEGLDRIIKIQDNPDNFGEYDYDEIADKINDLDVAEFQVSDVIGKLRSACESHKEIFKAKIK